MAHHTTLTLAEERLAQLRILAHRDGGTVADQVDRYINTRIAAGDLVDELPGFDILIANDSRIVFSIKGIVTPQMRPGEAKLLGKLLRIAADRVDEDTHSLLVLENGTPFSIAVKRKGRGLRMHITTEEGIERGPVPITPSMARDFARQIDAAVATV